MGSKMLGRLWHPRLLAAIILLTLAGLLAGAVSAYMSYRQAAAELIVQRDRQVALLTAVRLRDELSKLSDELTAIARSPSLYLGLPERQRLALRGASQRLSMFDGGVIFMDNTGRVRVTVPERWDIMSKQWADQEFFRSMLVPQPPAVHFSPVLNIGPEGAPVIAITVPVLGENRELVGALAGLFRIGESGVSPFYASIVRLRLPGTGNTFIVDSSGRVLYDSGYEQMGSVLALPAQGDVETAAISPALDADGEQVVASYAPVPGTSWTLVTETDWDEAMAPVQRFASGLVILLGLGMLIPTLAVALLARGQRAAGALDGMPGQETRLDALARQRLLPRQPPMIGGWDLALHHQTATRKATARDQYDFMLLPDGRLMLSLATIAEKGIDALSLMATTRAALRAAVSTTPSAAEALSICNNLLCPDMQSDSAVAVLLALLDPNTGRLQIANAGLAAPLRWNGDELFELREGVALLGQKLDVEYDQDEILLEPGESILFYSLGAVGIRPETGEPFGPARVAAALNSQLGGSAQALISALKEDIREFAYAESLAHLDVTFLALARPLGNRKSNKARRSLREELRALGETEIDL